MKIYIPSKGRHLSSNILAGPITQFSPAIRAKCVFVVYPDEEQNYRKTLQSMGLASEGVDVMVVQPGGIAMKRYQIGMSCLESGEEKFMMLDDDIRFIRRESKDKTTLVQTVPADLDQMFQYVESSLDAYSHVAVSARQGNNNMGVGSWHSLCEENTRTMRALAYRTEHFMRAKHCRVQFMEDFDVNLQLLRMKLKNLNLGWWSQDQKMTNAAGGCSDQRTHALHEKAAHDLAALHPEFVKLRQKVNKTGGDFGTRTEVTIFWKKAYTNG